jgi:hypothetical protein
MLAPFGGLQITISFTEFSTQPGKDLVRVFQCTDTGCSEQQLLAELSGTYSSTQAISSSTGYMKVVFTSDGSVNYYGFAAAWTMVLFLVWLHCFEPSKIFACLQFQHDDLADRVRHNCFYYTSKPECAIPDDNQLIDILITQWHVDYPCTGCTSACGLLVSKTGAFSDGSGSSNYPSNANCTWMLAPPAASVISITFTEFSTQPGKDLVRVFQCTDVGCSEQQLLAELSGTYLTTQNVTSASGYMKVVFTSDGSVNYDGFTASWITVSYMLSAGFAF